MPPPQGRGLTRFLLWGAGPLDTLMHPLPAPEFWGSKALSPHLCLSFWLPSATPWPPDLSLT